MAMGFLLVLMLGLLFVVSVVSGIAFGVGFMVGRRSASSRDYWSRKAGSPAVRASSPDNDPNPYKPTEL